MSSLIAKAIPKLRGPVTSRGALARYGDALRWIRPFEATDAQRAELEALHRSIMKEPSAAAGIMGQALGTARLAPKFDDRSAELLLMAAENDPRIAALVRPKYFRPDAAYIESLASRGQPLGGASAIQAIRRRFPDLDLELEATQGAVPFYRDLGFMQRPNRLMGGEDEGLPYFLLPAGRKLNYAKGGQAKRRADGGLVKSDREVAKTLREGALSGLRRYLGAIPQAVRDWPQQTWDMVRMPADLLLGSPDERRIDREFAPGELKPLPADTARNPHRPGSPESKAYETMAWANPLQAAVFAPAQTARMVASPVGQATLGGLAALTLPGVNMPSAFAVGNVIKLPGGQWLGTGEGGALRQALEGLKKKPIASLPETRLAFLEDAASRTEDPAVLERFNAERARLNSDVALNAWIEGPLRKYIVKRMASPEDEVRKLAEQGVLHYEPFAGPEGMMPLVLGQAARKRQKRGFPLEGFAKSKLGSEWEMLADDSVATTTARALQDPNEIPPSLAADAAWLDKANPDEVLYELEHAGTGVFRAELGLDHLIDELGNAVRPDSDLPANLRLRPENLNKLSMEQAVKRVAEINAWREAQKVAANKALANKAAVVREYAENNPKGLRWVELREAEAKLPEGYTVHTDPKNVGYTTIVDPQGRIAMGGATEKEAIGLLNRQERRQALADQLKYEGDTMGHCVGGYCDDVLSGRSRIFSLRDAKGEPHVTVEVRPNTRGLREYLSQFEHPEKPGRLEPDALGITDTLHDYVQANRLGNGDYDEFGLEMLRKLGHPEPPPSIVQIKGKANRAPNEEYLPFVQDFVRNSPLGGAWSDVGDLQNTGLRRTIDAFNSNELKKIQDAGIEVPFLATQQELQDIGKRVWPDSWGSILPVEKAEGGSVRAEDWKSAYNAGVNDGWKAEYNLSLQEAA